MRTAGVTPRHREPHGRASALKLTKHMRDAITKRIVELVRTPREVALRAQEQALAIRLLRQRYDDDVFDRCRALPAGWLQHYKRLSLAYSLREKLPKIRITHGNHVGVYPEGCLNLAEYAPLPNSAAGGWDRAAVGALFDELHALFEARIELHRQLEVLEQQTRAVLASFSTVEKLNDGWPEGYAHLPAELMMPATADLPAPRIADLNARIAALREAA